MAYYQCPKCNNKEEYNKEEVGKLIRRVATSTKLGARPKLIPLKCCWFCHYKGKGFIEMELIGEVTEDE